MYLCESVSQEKEQEYCSCCFIYWILLKILCHPDNVTLTSLIYKRAHICKKRRTIPKFKKFQALKQPPPVATCCKEAGQIAPPKHRGSLCVLSWKEYSKHTVATQNPLLLPLIVTSCDSRKKDILVYFLSAVDRQVIHNPQNICLIPKISYLTLKEVGEQQLQESRQKTKYCTRNTTALCKQR